jgi:hypothetical protein
LSDANNEPKSRVEATLGLLQVFLRQAVLFIITGPLDEKADGTG